MTTSGRGWFWQTVEGIGLAGLLGAGLLCACPASADPISFQVSSPTLSTTSGGTVTFTGAVTNDSGVNLNASDFFFNFFGFDATAVSPVQDLGVATDFSIANGTTANVTALFDVTLAAVPGGSTFPVEVQLEDINFDLSATQTVMVSVPGAVPEPGTLLLGTMSLWGVLALRPRKAGGGRSR